MFMHTSVDRTLLQIRCTDPELRLAKFSYARCVSGSVELLFCIVLNFPPVPMSNLCTYNLSISLDIAIHCRVCGVRAACVLRQLKRVAA
eukprot:SAG11_NODE_11779_length_738_cov_2.071987_1_plen_88_part_01